MNKLTPVSPFTLADAVERKICDYIRTNQMAEGDSLPKEEELAKTLNVSRNILREALSRLRMLGLVETRKKRGMVLAQSDGFVGLDRMLRTGLIGEAYRKDLIEMRIIMELGMTDYIFRRKTEKDIRELEAIVSKGNSAKAKRARVEEMEIAFHSKLYEMSGNNVVIHLEGILRSFFTYFEKPSRKKLKTPAPPTHRDICKVLRNGTAVEFREVMYRHLSVYKD